MPLSALSLTGGYPQKVVIQGVDLDLRPGEWLSLVGANGSGKSTLLRLLSRILPIKTGTVLLDGTAIHKMPSHLVARQIAVLPQQQQIPAGLTVRQLVALGRSPYQSWWQWEPTAQDLAQVAKALTATQLEDFSDRSIAELSGGERQRAFLALALAQTPRVLLLDEPTTYLDLRYQLQFLDLLRGLKEEQNLTVITVLHDLNLAARYSDRLALLLAGKIHDIGAVMKVLTPNNIAEVFGIQVELFKTVHGLQVIPIAMSNEQLTMNTSAGQALSAGN